MYPKWTPYHHATFLVWNKWDSLDRISYIDYPTLFLSGQKDELVPSEMMRKLYEKSASQNNKHFASFQHGLHETTCNEPGYISRFVDFIHKYS